MSLEHVHATVGHVQPDRRPAGELRGPGDQRRRLDGPIARGIHGHRRRAGQPGDQVDSSQRRGPAHRLDVLRRVFEHRHRGHAGPGAAARIVGRPTTCRCSPSIRPCRSRATGPRRFRRAIRNRSNPGQRQGAGHAGAGRIGHRAGLLRRHAAALGPGSDVVQLRSAASSPPATPIRSIGRACSRACSRRASPRGLGVDLRESDIAVGEHLGRLRADARQRGHVSGPAWARTSPTSASSGSSPSCRPTTPCSQRRNWTPRPTSRWPRPARCRWTSAASISRRSTSAQTLGPLGYGWTDDWQYSLTVGVRRHGDRHHARRANSGSSSPTAAAAITSTSRATTAFLTKRRRRIHPAGNRRRRSRSSTPTARSTTSRTPTATGSRPATRRRQLTSLTALRRPPRRFADDRLQRGRPDRVGHQLRRPHGQLQLRLGTIN